MIRNVAGEEDAEGNYKRGPEWKANWDGTISTVCWNKSCCHCNIKKSGTHFPTGLLSRAISFFKNSGIVFSISDIRKKRQTTSVYSMSPDFEPRDYQVEIINKIKGVNGAPGINRGIIKVATGGGKSALAAGIIAALGVTPTIFYVPSIDLLVQTKKELERFILCNGGPIEVGMVGGGYKDIRDITVMTVQTAVRSLGGVWVKFDDEDFGDDDTDISDKKDEIKSLIEQAGLIICDEVQHWVAETCQIISDHSNNCQYRFGCSATPWRDSGDDILIDGCFGKCIADINASELIRRGYLVKPMIYFMDIDNVQHPQKVSYAAIYKMGIVENDFRNNRIIEMVDIFKKDGRNILILVKQIAHGNLLESLIPDSIFLYGGTAKKKRLEHLQKMKRGEHQITISSVIFDEGIDVRPLDTLILAGSGKSSTRALQRIGRILRPYPGKNDAIAVDFMDHCKYLKKHSQARLKIYETEKEFAIIKKGKKNG
jgi:superfamily II DNA or RNA helicase